MPWTSASLCRLAAAAALLGLAAAGCAGNRVVLDWDARTLTFRGKPIQPVDLLTLARDHEPGTLTLETRSSEGVRTRDLRQAVDELDAADLALLTLHLYPPPDDDLLALHREALAQKRLQERHWQTQLAPAVIFIRSFLEQQNRLPTREELEAWRQGRPDPPRLHLVTNGDFLAARGGTPGRDFAVGVWTGGSYYYVQSWDGQYVTYRWERGR